MNLQVMQNWLDTIYPVEIQLIMQNSLACLCRYLHSISYLQFIELQIAQRQ